MKSRLRPGTLILVALMGMSLVFSPGCVGKKKKSKTATELPSDKGDSQASSSSSTGDDTQRADASSGSSAYSDSSSSSGSNYSSRSQDVGSYSSGSSSRSGVDPYASGSGDGKDTLAGGSGSGDTGGAGSIESPHAAATVGDSSGQEMSAGSSIDDQSPVPTPKKKKKGKKKKKAIVAQEDSGDGADDSAVDASGSYTVKKGDTLSKIAKSHGISLKKLMSINSLSKEDASKLRVGTRLKTSSKA